MYLLAFLVYYMTWIICETSLNEFCFILIPIKIVGVFVYKFLIQLVS